MLVSYATVLYGSFAFLLAATRLLPVGCLAVTLMAATDAVGATLRGQVVQVNKTPKLSIPPQP